MFFPEKPVPVEVVRELASLLRANNLGELTIESGDVEGAMRLQLQRETVTFVPSSPVGATTATESGEALVEVTTGEEETTSAKKVIEVAAPCVGFYRTPKKPLEVGKRVRAGQVIAVVESLRVPNEVLAPADATVLELPIAEGEGVEWGETLVVLDPSA